MKADDIPDLDEWFFDEYWTCGEWQSWYYANKLKYGKQNATTKFFFYWDKQTFGASALDCRTFDLEFRKFLSNEGMLSRAMQGLGIFTLPLQTYGAASDVVQTASNQISSARKYILPVAVLSLLSFAAYKLSR